MSKVQKSVLQQYGIVNAFGVELDSPNIDLDLIILLGLIVFAVVFGIISALVERLKKMSKSKQK